MIRLVSCDPYDPYEFKYVCMYVECKLYVFIYIYMYVYARARRSKLNYLQSISIKTCKKKIQIKYHGGFGEFRNALRLHPPRAR